MDGSAENEWTDLRKINGQIREEEVAHNLGGCRSWSRSCSNTIARTSHSASDVSSNFALMTCLFAEQSLIITQQ